MEDEHKRFPSLFCSPETFRRRLEYIAKHFKVIDLDDAVTQMDQDRVAPGQVVLTFDDGYYNFVASAAPLLRQFEMTATIYVVSGNMCLGEPYHPLVLRDTILTTTLEKAVVSIPGLDQPQPLGSPEDRQRLKKGVLEHLWGLPCTGTARIDFCRRLAGELDVDFDGLIESRKWNSLTPTEACGLIRDGFSIELHSHTHRHVTDIADEVAEETRQCRELVERATGVEAVHYCYPSGYWEKRTWTALAEAGIRSATTVQSGPNFAKTPLLALRRLLDAEEQTQLEFEFELSNLRWLLHVLFHPAQRYEPPEIRLRYAKNGILF